jgi:hypothetical protein
LTTAATNSAVEYLVALNGLFNVDITGGAVTPYMWSVINTLYNKYRVDACRYTIRFLDTTQDGIQVGAQLRGASCTGQTIPHLSQRPGNVMHAMSNTGEQSVVIRAATDCAEAFGQTHPIYRANYGAVVSSNPGGSSPDFTLILHIFMAANSVAVSSVLFTVDLEFDVDLFDCQV